MRPRQVPTAQQMMRPETACHCPVDLCLVRGAVCRGVTYNLTAAPQHASTEPIEHHSGCFEGASGRAVLQAIASWSLICAPPPWRAMSAGAVPGAGGGPVPLLRRETGRAGAVPPVRCHDVLSRPPLPPGGRRRGRRSTQYFPSCLFHVVFMPSHQASPLNVIIAITKASHHQHAHRAWSAAANKASAAMALQPPSSLSLKPCVHQSCCTRRVADRAVLPARAGVRRRHSAVPAAAQHAGPGAARLARRAAAQPLR